MGRVSDLRIEIQESPEYRDGWESSEAGYREGSNPWPVIDPRKRNAWALGWADAKNELVSP